MIEYNFYLVEDVKSWSKENNVLFRAIYKKHSDDEERRILRTGIRRRMDRKSFKNNLNLKKVGIIEFKSIE